MERSRTKKRPWPIYAIIAALLLIIVTLLLVQNCGNAANMGQSGPERDLAAELGILPGTSVEEIQRKLDASVAEGRLRVSINPAINFQDDQSEGDVRIENNQSNHYAFTVAILVEETGYEFLKTGLIEPGYYVEYYKPNAPIERGLYDCIAVFTAYDLDTMEQVGQTNAQVVVAVHN